MYRLKQLLLPLGIILLTLGHSEDEFFTAKSNVGGYGELHLNYKNPETGKAEPIKWDFHRFVLFASHHWTPQWSFKSEVELEHNYVKGERGELELEQAYIEYMPSQAFFVRSGVLLVDAGIININHEPPLFFSVERPDYANVIIPTTWFGNGFGVGGKNSFGVGYSLNLMEGLSTDKIKPANDASANGIRGARDKGYESKNGNLLMNLALSYTGMEGLKLGGSYTRNHLMKNNGKQIYKSINIIEAHIQAKKWGVIFNSEVGYTTYDPIGNISGMPKAGYGYYSEVGYNLGQNFKTKAEIIPWVRWSQLNPYMETTTSSSNKDKQEKIIQLGMSLKPIPQVVFKSDIGWTFKENSNSNSFQFNLGSGYMF